MSTSSIHSTQHDGAPQIPPQTLPSPSIPLTPFTNNSTTTSRPHASTDAAARRRPAAFSRSSTVGIRRLPSARRIPTHVTLTAPDQGHEIAEEEETEHGGRRRSTSAPQPATRQTDTSDPSRRTNRSSHILPAVEEVSGHTPITTPAAAQPRPGWFSRRLPSQSATSTLGLQPETSRDGLPKQQAQRTPTHEYNTNIVDLLDVLDPEVATLSTLNNVQNSLFVPDLGRLINRRPTYDLSTREADNTSSNRKPIKRSMMEKRLPPLPKPDTISEEEEGYALRHVLSQRPRDHQRSSMRSLHTINSQLSDSHFAVLPHGLTLEDWSEHDKAELNDHVRHLLHSRREKFKRSMRGFKKYISKPLGFLVTLYAFCITVFGLFWILFLIGWLGGGSRHAYFINVIDNVLVALFAVIGDGLAPFRCVDTYHMSFIAHYARLEWRLRATKNLPALTNPNDLPTIPADTTSLDLERAPSLLSRAKSSPRDYLALTPLQQRRLAHHQAKFSKSHTFYKPHETPTHHAFSIHLLIAIVALLDGHSAFQIALGACTWGISYHVRPQALTAVILCCSITCNITAGVLISIGDKRSRKKEVLERMFRQELTGEALEKMRERRGVVAVPAGGGVEEEEEDFGDRREEYEREGEGEGDVTTSGESSFDKIRHVVRGRRKSMEVEEEEEEEEDRVQRKATRETEREVRREVGRETAAGVRDFAVRGAGVD